MSRTTIWIMPRAQLLTQVLADYPSTLLQVSHDPDFVEGVGLSWCIGWWGRGAKL